MVWHLTPRRSSHTGSRVVWVIVIWFSGSNKWHNHFPLLTPFIKTQQNVWAFSAFWRICTAFIPSRLQASLFGCGDKRQRENSLVNKCVFDHSTITCKCASANHLWIIKRRCKAMLCVCQEALSNKCVSLHLPPPKHVYLSDVPPLFHGWSPQAPEPRDPGVWQSPLFYPGKRTKEAVTACFSWHHSLVKTTPRWRWCFHGCVLVLHSKGGPVYKVRTCCVCVCVCVCVCTHRISATFHLRKLLNCDVFKLTILRSRLHVLSTFSLLQ